MTLDGKRLSDQKLQIGGVYSLIVQENENGTVSKKSLFFYSSIIMSIFMDLRNV
jgi:hypothetical protein